MKPKKEFPLKKWNQDETKEIMTSMILTKPKEIMTKGNSDKNTQLAAQPQPEWF